MIKIIKHKKQIWNCRSLFARKLYWHARAYAAAKSGQVYDKSERCESGLMYRDTVSESFLDRSGLKCFARASKPAQPRYNSSDRSYDETCPL